jgi:alanine racemase
VASITEALELRFSGISRPILILGWTPDHRAEELIKHQLTPTVFRLEQAKYLSSAAAVHHQTLKLHIKVDTGMNRLGLPPTQNSVTEIAAINRLPYLEIEGVFTHLALFFTDDNHFSLQQADRFLDFTQQLERAGIYIPLRHIANSAGLLDVPGDDFNLVRVGSALYGLNPRAGIPRDQMDIRPAMTFKTVISHVKNVPAGHGISYGHTYTTTAATRVATIPVGYVDGITKIGSGKTEALVRGERVRQIGMICMDQCRLDVSHVPEAAPGDEVIFFGTDGTHTLSPDERAKILGTGNCEIVCAVSRRVPRVYWSGGRVVNVINYVTDPPSVG